MPTALIGLGSNLGDRAALLDRATARLGEHPNIDVVARSKPYATAPIGGPAGQGEYLNSAVRVLTTLSPQALFEVLQQIEKELGRARSERWSARTIDLDLLLYDDLVLETPALRLPHPRMSFRRFVLTPASEIAPQMIHPTTGWPIRRLLEHLDTAPNYVAIAGPVAVGKTQLASEVAQRTGARLILDEIDPQLLARFNADPTATAWELETSLLHRRAALLAECFSNASSDEATDLAISDFWFDQSLVYSRLSLTEPPQRQFERLWHELRQQVPSPKLLVLLQAPVDQLRERIARQGRTTEQSLSSDELQRPHTGLREQAAQPDQGPVLVLNALDHKRAIEEVSAAMQAMR